MSRGEHELVQLDPHAEGKARGCKAHKLEQLNPQAKSKIEGHSEHELEQIGAGGGAGEPKDGGVQGAAGLGQSVEQGQGRCGRGAEWLWSRAGGLSHFAWPEC